MRILEHPQQQLLSDINPKERIPADHALRPQKVVTDTILKQAGQQFNAVYSMKGRPSIPSERLFRVSPLLVLFTIRSERKLVVYIDFNLSYFDAYFATETGRTDGFIKFISDSQKVTFGTDAAPTIDAVHFAAFRTLFKLKSKCAIGDAP